MLLAGPIRCVLAFVVLTMAAAAIAEDTLKLAIGQRGNWENAPPELGQKAGIFKKHGLTLEILYTQGAGETLQAVISGSVDIGIGVGTAGTLGAFAKGAPVRAIANSMTGADDLFWYVPTESPIKTFKDTAGKTVAYSTNGSSTNLAVLAFMREFGVPAKPVATPARPLRSRRRCRAKSTSAGRLRPSGSKPCSRVASGSSCASPTCRRFAIRPFG
jgi:NitT/TauT family transport system substrate-binding protein